MTTCPHCGAQTDGPVCSSCGRPVGESMLRGAPAMAPDAPSVPAPATEPAPPVGPGLTERASREWAAGAHVSAVAGLVVPLGGIIAPLVIRLTKGRDDPFVERHAREALNFNISYTIYSLILTIPLLFILSVNLIRDVLDDIDAAADPPSVGEVLQLLFSGPALVFTVLSILITVGWLVAVIVATVRAWRGREFRYPVTIRFVRNPLR